MRRVCVLAVAILVSLAQAARAQEPTDAELKRLADAYTAAWNKGDAKALAALHTTEGMRVAIDGKVAIGRQAIEQSLTELMAGPYRGTKLGIVQGQTTRVSQDVYVNEGRFSVAGGAPPAGAPTRGHYVNTLVRQSGRWLIGVNVAFAPPPPPPPPKK
jgi:uncharacterized protein (TIGR02246 family)